MKTAALLISKQLCVLTWMQLNIKMKRLNGGTHA